MKRTRIVLPMALLALSACQQAPEPVAVDLEAEKAAVAAMYDSFSAAYEARDAASLAGFLTEDVLFCGTDPSEFFNKAEFTEIWTQFFSDSTIDTRLSTSRLEIRVAADGASATIVQQYLMPYLSPTIPIRNIYKAVKTGDRWMMDFVSANFIPLNEDLPKINAAVE
jgi:uncharacterized protein (TIGR02246 family)